MSGHGQRHNIEALSSVTSTAQVAQTCYRSKEVENNYAENIKGRAQGIILRFSKIKEEEQTSWWNCPGALLHEDWDPSPTSPGHGQRGFPQLGHVSGQPKHHWPKVFCCLWATAHKSSSINHHLLINSGAFNWFTGLRAKLLLAITAISDTPFWSHLRQEMYSFSRNFTVHILIWDWKFNLFARTSAFKKPKNNLFSPSAEILWDYLKTA